MQSIVEEAYAFCEKKYLNKRYVEEHSVKIFEALILLQLPRRFIIIHF